MQPEKWIADTAVCGAPQQAKKILVQALDTFHQTLSLGFKSFNGVFSVQVTFKLVLRHTHTRMNIADGLDMSFCKGHRFLKTEIGTMENMTDVFLINLRLYLQYWTPKCVSESANVTAQVSVCPQTSAVVLQVFTLSGSAVLTVVCSYSPCVVYCGPEPTMGPIPLQICLPKKLLWWNVRQGKGRWGQTVKLFSLSLCFTPLTDFQNLHLAVIASKKEEFNQSVFMRLCVLFAYLITDAVLCLEICWIYICVRTLE